MFALNTRLECEILTLVASFGLMCHQKHLCDAHSLRNVVLVSADVCLRQD